MAMKRLEPSRAIHVQSYSLDLLCRIGEREIDQVLSSPAKPRSRKAIILYETFRDTKITALNWLWLPNDANGDAGTKPQGTLNLAKS